MKKAYMLFCLTLSLFVCTVVGKTVSVSASGLDVDIASHKACQYCGMDREKFAHSRMLIEFEDGSSVATCSLHCAAVDFANNIDKSPKAIKVADYGSKQLLDAEKAVWVIGTRFARTSPTGSTRCQKWKDLLVTL
jgi:nitrous oxide reductase accessory protein NosL